MTITEKRCGTELTLAIEGSLDTTSFKQLEQKLQTALDGVEFLVLDCKDLEYVSSAGLRAMLAAQKAMSKQGKMVVRGANESVMDTFVLTGFTKVLTIE